MKITAMECFFVLPRWNFLKITTDEGIVGWGEPVVESRAQTVAKEVEELSRILIGEDPLRIEHLFQTMYRTTFYRGGPVLTSAISGIEQALWDIKGKYYGLPVYEMLGGRSATISACIPIAAARMPRNSPPMPSAAWPRALPQSKPL